MVDNDVPYRVDLLTHRPASSRAYNWLLGGKDNYPVDRDFVLKCLQRHPEALDIGRESRLFLYRAVRYLAGEAGISQFLDLGSGYPTERNVHQVAQYYNPRARVVYVDIDPIVLAHGRALLANTSSTAMVTGDITQPHQYLDHPDTQRLIDFTQPLAVLLFSIPHCVPDDAAALRAVHGPLEGAAPGSYLALSHVVADTATSAEASTRTITELGMAWRTRTTAHVATWLESLEPVAPGLGDVKDWRPDETQPPLREVAPELADYVGASLRSREIYEYGGVLRLP